MSREYYRRRPRRRSTKDHFFLGMGAGAIIAAAAACLGLGVFALVNFLSPDDSGMFPSEIAQPVLAVEPPEYGEYGYDYGEPAQPAEVPLSSLPFYLPENSEAYAEFRAQRPDLDAESIVWKVNVMLHVPFFSDIRINNNPNTLLVNPQFRLPPGFSPSGLVPVNSSSDHLHATPETVTAFREMRAAARQYGHTLQAASAFRSAERQRQLWEGRGRVDGSTARPYHSEHQTGRAIDLAGPGGLLDERGPSPTGEWVANNAHRFGFIVRYHENTTHITGYIFEPWHITFVGHEISMYMYENNILTLEEFVGRNPHLL